MSEELVVEQTERQVASIGKVERANFNTNAQQQTTTTQVENTATQENNSSQEQQTQEEISDAARGTSTTEFDISKLTPDQIKEAYEKAFPKEIELTDEQKAAKAAAEDKELLDLYVANGGTIEHFSALKTIVSMDLAQLSKDELVREMKLGGFDDTEISEMLVERYYQLNPDELEQGDDEDDEEFNARKEKIKKKVAYGTEKLTKRSAHIQQQAKGVLEGLKTAINQKNLDAKEEADFIAEIDEVSKALPRKLSVSLGKLNNEDLGSVETEVSEEDIAEVVSTLKEAEKRKQFLYNENGKLNSKRLAELLLKEKMLEKVTRESLLEGQTRQVAIFRQKFPINNAYALGVGGNTQQQPSSQQERKVAGFGKPQRVR